jgi:tetratricopeptide (TPR) repeat protein
MTKKHLRSISNKQHQPVTPPELNNPSEASCRVPLWQALILPLAAILIFFFLLEGGLALFGIRPALQTDDPFVGFAANVPLFLPTPGPGGLQQLATAPNKRNFFNFQSFPQKKAPNAYRIFCLGGSTTYGRPYNDATSFAGWLRELLPAADKSKAWEVINAGGISYASYRVAHLMEELIHYQPDLFLIYTGHNEFLEERTYSKLRDRSPAIQTTVSLLANTRTWAAMSTALRKMGIYRHAKGEAPDQLAGEVNTILDRSAGPERYTRDDQLREHILQHYRISLERMVGLADSVGARVIFVTPASNLKDCSPFKSEHTPGLDPAARWQAEQMMASAKEKMGQEDWNQALDLIDRALASDPRHAELQFRRGQVLFALGRFAEAASTLRRARDEDVCPLRALTPMRRIVTEVARDRGVGLVDYVELLERRMQEAQGFPIPGQEYFLDHVHPTIEGNKILAVALIRAMIDQGLVQPGVDWGEQAITAVAAKVEGRIDRQAHGEALTSLARVFIWAGKTEDADRLAQQALDVAGEYRQVAVDAASILTSVYQRQGHPQRAVQLLNSALEKAPGAIELRLKLGRALLNPPFMNFAEAAANLLLVCQQMPNFDVAHQLFGQAMASRGRPRIAYNSLLEALRLNPKNANAKTTLSRIRPLLGEDLPSPQAPAILLEIYPSRAPRKLVQVGRDASGRPVPDGIIVEWHENGRLKSFLDVEKGVANGLELTWDAAGRQLSRVGYRQGKVVDGRDYF